MITLTIRDTRTLHNTYMPFIENGGLFIPDHEGYGLGDEVFVLLSLPGGGSKIPVAGKVVWVAAPGVKNPHAVGLGVQFNDTQARDKIETCLAGFNEGDRVTATM